jgi:hypothetical protein
MAELQLRTERLGFREVRRSEGPFGETLRYELPFGETLRYELPFGETLQWGCRGTLHIAMMPPSTTRV